MVRITSIARSGDRSVVDVAGSIAGAARAIAEAREGLAMVRCRNGCPHAVRITDVVMIQLLDVDIPLAELHSTATS